MVEIDAGNTFVKWRKVLPGGDFRNGRVETSHLNNSNDLFSGCYKCAATLDDVLISSVLSDDQTKKLISHLRRYFVGRIYLAKVVNGLAGVHVAYDQPQSLGVDRWLVMIAAYRTIYDAKGICVIDAGSAITADFITVGGQHVGGCIMPGRKLLNSALHVNTQRVRASAGQGEVQDIGKSTEECVGAGLQHMLLGSVSRLISLANRMRLSHVVITGGDGEALLSLTSGEAKMIFVPDLVLDGLSEVHRLGGLIEV